jgi:AcrR family transcriptional regulator
LDAARELFPRYGYRGVSSRQIGAAAGVNFAMIRYYFGGKPGLYREMLQGVLQPARVMTERLATKRSAPAGGSFAPGRDSLANRSVTGRSVTRESSAGTLDAISAPPSPPQLAEVLENMTRAWAENPWVAGFVVREVLAPDGPMRAMFLREFPERLMPVVERVVEGEIAAGRLRSDIDPRMLVLSIVSLAIFPFLTIPLTTRVFGVRNDEEFVGRFLRHTTELLTRGVGPSSFAVEAV